MKNLNLPQQQILSYWHTLEYLIPFNLDQTIDTAEANSRRYFRFDKNSDDSDLPWLTASEMEHYQYQVYFGVFDVRTANNDLLWLFHKANRDSRNDFLSCFGCFTVDNNGIPLPETLLLCSLPWALGHLESGEINKKIKESDWDLKFKAYSRSVTTVLEDNAHQLKNSKSSLDEESFRDLIVSLTELGGWTNCEFEALAYCFVNEAKPTRQKDEQETIRSDSSGPVEEIVVEEDNDDKILNSFYAKEIQTVKNSFAVDDCGAAIKNFLNQNELTNAEKFNLDKKEILEGILAPRNIPLGRWASENKKYQSLMQQAAINLSLTKIKENGNLLSVNGPPGTGKTTMLRDIIAALIVKRAMQMSSFDNPHAAFKPMRTIPLDYGKPPTLYQPNSQITGFEMVVASSNNSAVKNVTQEIPDKKSISREHQDEAAYFQQVADNVFADNEQVEPWGMVAAILGNSSNKYEFKKKFWSEQTPEDELFRCTFQSFLWQEENIARMFDWKQAKEEFLDLHAQVSRIIQQRQTYFDAIKTERRLTTELSEINKNLQIISRKIAEIQNKKEFLSKKSQLLSVDRSGILENIAAVSISKPAAIWFYLMLIYVHPDVEKYNQRMNSAQSELDEINKKIAVCAKEGKVIEAKLSEQTQLIRSIKKQESTVLENLRRNEPIISAGKSELGAEAFADDDWWNKNESELQKRAPWLDEELNHLRSRLFLKAVKLHEVFIKMSRAKISDNLKLWAEIIGGKNAAISKEQALNLWQTFFLVVPVVSTTFASLGRMFEHLGRESIGWLLIDEAGQATPQAAVGGIWRAKQAVIVGDPLQIEPVVGLDEAVVEQIREFYGVDARWSLKNVSVQTLADSANPFGAYISNENSRFWVGCPLRVHRRCLNPMFGIANKIAYGGKMVYATTADEKDSFGDSRWIHTNGKCVRGHWNDELWQEVKKSLTEAMETNGSKNPLPKLFIITPFRDVARELKRLVVDHKSEWLFDKRISRKELKRWAGESIGTVHTFQGKEKEIVIFVLGADETTKSSAQWAADKPNILNVAVTRAKNSLFIVGNKNVWGNLPFFRTAHQKLSDN